MVRIRIPVSKLATMSYASTEDTGSIVVLPPRFLCHDQQVELSTREVKNSRLFHHRIPVYWIRFQIIMVHFFREGMGLFAIFLRAYFSSFERKWAVVQTLIIFLGRKIFRNNSRGPHALASGKLSVGSNSPSVKNPVPTKGSIPFTASINLCYLRQCFDLYRSLVLAFTTTCLQLICNVPPIFKRIMLVCTTGEDSSIIIQEQRVANTSCNLGDTRNRDLFRLFYRGGTVGNA
mmetsp:Transcript_12464/g.22358  ORF Transcript_12464/g.22358 Transcript_12464/m.22358 type:complete len:233 (-) Transcript_12464:353-1051(-)